MNRQSRRGSTALVALVAPVMLLVACSTPPTPPPADLAAVNTPYRQAPAASTDALDAATWRGFGDPVLDSLLARARSANLDVRIAVQRVRQARAGSTATALKTTSSVDPS